MMEVIYKEQSYRIMGCCFRGIQSAGLWLPGGGLSGVFGMEIEFTSQGIPFVPAIHDFSTAT